MYLLTLRTEIYGHTESLRPIRQSVNDQIHYGHPVNTCYFVSLGFEMKNLRVFL